MISSVTKNLDNVSVINKDITDLKMSVEALSENQENFAETIRDLPSFDSIMTNVDAKIKAMKEQQKKIDERQDKQKASSSEISDVLERIYQLESSAEYQDTLVTNIDKLSERLGSLEKKVADNKDLKDLTKKITQMETKLQDNTGNDNDLSYVVEQLQDSVGEALSAIPKLAKLEKKVDNNHESLEKTCKNLDNKIEGLQSDLKVQKNDLNLINSKFDDKPLFGKPEKEEKGDNKLFEAFKKENMDDISRLDNNIEILQSQIEEIQENCFKKIGELKVEMSKADEQIKRALQQINKMSIEDTNATFREIMDIKNEIIEISHKMDEKMKKMGKEEDKKQEDVLNEIAKIYKIINEKHEHVSSSIKKLQTTEESFSPFGKTEAKPAKPTTVASDDSNEKIKKQFEAFKSESAKEKEAEVAKFTKIAKEIRDTKEDFETLLKKELDKAQKDDIKRYNELHDEIKKIHKVIKDNKEDVAASFEKFQAPDEGFSPFGKPAAKKEAPKAEVSDKKHDQFKKEFEAFKSETSKEKEAEVAKFTKIAKEIRDTKEAFETLLKKELDKAQKDDIKRYNELHDEIKKMHKVIKDNKEDVVASFEKFQAPDEGFSPFGKPAAKKDAPKAEVSDKKQDQFKKEFEAFKSETAKEMEAEKTQFTKFSKELKDSKTHLETLLKKEVEKTSTLEAKHYKELTLEIEKLYSFIDKKHEVVSASIKKMETAEFSPFGKKEAPKEDKKEEFSAFGKKHDEMQKELALLKTQSVKAKESEKANLEAMVKEIKENRKEVENIVKKEVEKAEKKEEKNNLALLAEIEKIYKLINEKHDHLSSTLKKIETSSSEGFSPFGKKEDKKEDKKEVGFSAFEDAKKGLQKEFEIFKSENAKDKEFERDRILNCVTELNENKKYCDKLVKQEIDNMAKQEEKKHQQILVALKDYKTQFKTIEEEIKGIEKGLKVRDEKMKKTESQVDELYTKYAKVIRLANELSDKVSLEN
jgi:hypothetical protein